MTNQVFSSTQVYHDCTWKIVASKSKVERWTSNLDSPPSITVRSSFNGNDSRFGFSTPVTFVKVLSITVLRFRSFIPDYLLNFPSFSFFQRKVKVPLLSIGLSFEAIVVKLWFLSIANYVPKLEITKFWYGILPRYGFLCS